MASVEVSWLQLVMTVLSGVVGASIIAALMAPRTHRMEQQHTVLARVHDRRVKEFPKLWNATGEVCTPNEIKDKDPVLGGGRVAKCYEDVRDWYREHGILLDPHSRVWTILLREQTAAWVRDDSQERPTPDQDSTSTSASAPGQTENTLRWDGNDTAWPRIWLIKTALRILLETTLSEPQLKLRGLWHHTWPTGWSWLIRRRLRSELLLKFRIVDQIALSNRNEVQRKGLVEEVLLSAMGFPSQKKGGDRN